MANKRPIYLFTEASDQYASAGAERGEVMHTCLKSLSLWSELIALPGIEPPMLAVVEERRTDWRRNLEVAGQQRVGWKAGD
jgi:hypothetical protein